MRAAACHSGYDPGMSTGMDQVGVESESLVVAMSSGRISISGVFGLVGWRDTASAALCRTPGMYTILNL